VSWSPEGDRIAYQVGLSESTDVFTYDLTNNTGHQLTSFAGPDSAPTWDCGGGNISFTSLSSGNLDVYSTPWTGGEISFITNNPASDKWSEWSPAKEPGSRGY
jgi:Tol biopolymer transport system component